MRPSLYQWLIGIVLALTVHILAFASLRGDETAKIERASGPVISVAGSLSDYASEVETIVQDTAETVAAEDKVQKIQPDVTVDATPAEHAIPVVAAEEKPKKIKPGRVYKKKTGSERTKERKSPKKSKSRVRRNRTAGRQGGGGGRGQSRYAGKSALSNFKGRVRARIARRARSAKAHGTVVVRFTVTANGGVANVRVIRSANSALNTAAVQAVRGGFPPIPPSLPNKISFTIPIVFK